jgi:hypothetical protein
LDATGVVCTAEGHQKGFCNEGLGKENHRYSDSDSLTPGYNGKDGQLCTNQILMTVSIEDGQIKQNLLKIIICKQRHSQEYSLGGGEAIPFMVQLQFIGANDLTSHDWEEFFFTAEGGHGPVWPQCSYARVRK